MPLDYVDVINSNGERGTQTVLRLLGPLSARTVFEFQDAVRANTSDVLIVDFSRASHIDSAGLGALVGAYVGAKKARRKFAIAAPNEQVKTLLGMMHLAALFPTYASVHDAEVGIF
ncbi:MAG TPA: STAS domain-containing protein [Candidatus Aquilonibacter sp.]|nr:STAS domain-containing protein [Candidatus Aquilonibacter sp.]